MSYNGTEVVAYTYDTWGNILSVTGSRAATVGADNPFRYKGYYWDEETGLYYLNQRYYNPEWGRFINADDLIGETGDLLGHNLFAYCQNNPVMNSDPSGCAPEDGYYDYMFEQARRREAIKTEPIIRQVLEENANYAHTNHLGWNIGQWIDLVKDKGDWDYKRPEVRARDSRLESIASSRYVSYEGIVMDWEQFGNFHYGYVGHAAPFSGMQLQLGSWYAADFVYDENEKEDWHWIILGFASY